jgi:hypothetical protein
MAEEKREKLDVKTLLVLGAGLAALIYLSRRRKY